MSCVERVAARTADGEVEVRGRFAHAARSNQTRQNWLYLVDGDLLRASDRSLAGETSFTGMGTATVSGQSIAD